jgi:hypothetical protein
MSDAIAHVDPAILARVLKDLDGVSFDPSTEEGTKGVAELVRKYLEHPDQEKRLLDAIDGHSRQALMEEAVFPSRYGPIRTAPRVAPSDERSEVPPIGSAEFDAYMDTPDEAASMGDGSSLPVAEPSALGFKKVAVGEPPTLEAVDMLLRKAQQHLDARRGPLSQGSFFARLFKARTDPISEKDAFAMPLARNWFSVEVSSNNARLVTWDSVAFGNYLYLRLSKRGVPAFRGCFLLTDTATVKELSDVFADEPAIGSTTLHALRLAMSRTHRATQAGATA